MSFKANGRKVLVQLVEQSKLELSRPFQAILLARLTDDGLKLFLNSKNSNQLELEHRPNRIKSILVTFNYSVYSDFVRLPFFY